MVAHEYAHAEAAYRQGDSTAYMLGRLTFNPLKHIDPFMTVLLPILLWYSTGGRYTFGGAKPVPVNPRNYRHYVRGDIIVSLAGIAVNLVLFVIFTALFATVGTIAEALPSLSATLGILQKIPPLDGSHVFYHLLPPGAGAQYRQFQRFGFFPIVLVSYMLPGVIQFFLWPAYQLLRLALGLVIPVALPGGLPT
jgi:Zn-dependent protease